MTAVMLGEDPCGTNDEDGSKRKSRFITEALRQQDVRSSPRSEKSDTMIRMFGQLPTPFGRLQRYREISHRLPWCSIASKKPYDMRVRSPGKPPGAAIMASKRFRHRCLHTVVPVSG